MEEKKRNTALTKSDDELPLAIPIPANQRNRLYLRTSPYLHEYDPQTEADMTDGHKRLRKIMDYFEDKESTDTIFGEHALRVFMNVDRLLYNVWWTKIEVTMEEVFPILDGLRYGRDTIALLAIVSPSSYRLLFKIPDDDDNPPIPTFTLESGMIGLPLERRPDLNLRMATFYEEATRATRHHKTTMFKAFVAARIQGNLHGGCISTSRKPIKRVFWKLESSTPHVDRLAMDYQVLALMKDAPSPKSKICMRGNQVVYDSKSKEWYSVSKPISQPKSRKEKVSLSKKREDSRLRMVKYRANKVADKNSFRTVTDLTSSAEFCREARSRSSSIRKPPETRSVKVTTPVTCFQHSPSAGKKRR